ncbi:hypothetical protein ES703_111339 [subsurface metagenome]
MSSLTFPSFRLVMATPPTTRTVPANIERVTSSARKIAANMVEKRGLEPIIVELMETPRLWIEV